MLNEIYKESIDLFYETFNVPHLMLDIISRIKNPATCGKLYDVELIKVDQEGFRLKLEFKTNEDTYFTQSFNLDNRLDAADDFLGQLGYSLSSIKNAVGEKYKVFYGNMFNTIVLGKVNK